MEFPNSCCRTRWLRLFVGRADEIAGVTGEVTESTPSEVSEGS